jgi:deoxyribonuclease V
VGTPTHPWNVAPEEAVRIQEQLGARLILSAPEGPFERVAGAFAAMREGAQQAVAAALVMSLPSFRLLETAVARAPIPLPYTPGLLAFCVGPALIAALAKLQTYPDVVLIAGHGLAHPRRFGLAAHVGLLLDLPTIGCAEEALCGAFESPGPHTGDREAIVLGEEVVGAAVRVREGVGPLFVSPGHRMDVDTAVAVALRAAGRFRTPEPLRRARALARRVSASDR